METFAAEYIEIIKVDLESGLAAILKAGSKPFVWGKDIPLALLIERYAEQWVYPEDIGIVHSLTRDKLEAFYDGREPVFPIVIRCFDKAGGYDWIEITGKSILEKGRKLLIMTRIFNEERIMRKVTDLYDYQNFDCFVLLNAENNSYTMFSGKKGVALLPDSSDDYEKEMERFNRKFIVAEEVKETIAKMKIKNVKAMLETQNKYAFNAGSITHEGKYQRSRVQFTYYDKSAGLILLTRRDVTQLYPEEKEKWEENYVYGGCGG